MPRKKQTVQQQKRQKTYAGGSQSGDATHIKPKGAFRMFSSYRTFAIIGAIALGGGFIATAILSARGTNPSADDSGVRGEGVVRTTPEAGSTAEAETTTERTTYSAPPAMTIDATKTYVATIKTEKGDVTVALDPAAAPATVNNFVFLAREGFYDGQTFFRVIADEGGTLHFAQAGDPTGTGSGGPGYELPVEATDTSFVAGVLAMAKPPEAGTPNNGSQFFFTLQEEPTLDGKFTAFGQITAGLAVLSQLDPRDPDRQAPDDLGPAVRIESIEIIES